MLRDSLTKPRSNQQKLMETLRLSEERFRLLIESVKDYAIFLLDPDGYVMSWNAGAQRVKGYTAQEIIGQHFSVFYTPEDRAIGKPRRLLGLALQQGRIEDEGWRVRKDGVRFMANVVMTAVHDENGALRGYAKVTRDITERKQTEDLLRQKQQQILALQKVESIGRMAGGIAHDFNNILIGIMGCAESLQETLKGYQATAEDLREILTACERGASLTRQLMAFGRQQIATPTLADVNQMVMDMQKLLLRLIRANIEMRLNLSPDLPLIKIDPGQFQQIFMNLVINARDAMPVGGRLIFETRCVALDPESVSTEFGIKQGEYVMLSISDTGTGMTPEVQERIFEPFFTTKEVGKGTGLGLSTVYGIVQQNAGAIALYSTPGVGTTFKVLLPVASDHTGDIESLRSSAAEADFLEQYPESILVVEDDALVLRNIVRILRGRGYTVLSATDGESALKLFDVMNANVSLVLTDVIMPKMNGKQLADQLHQVKPDLPILYMSGYAADIVAQHGLLKKEIQFLEKPFSAATLTKKIRDVLDSNL